ncbi:MAG: choice-of-anchor L domain-containing protein [Gammaproteobacteria bacterium]|nr:choice-of-anchor L domain-containing protein [Gammaproteobacteria bacterium]
MHTRKAVILCGALAGLMTGPAAAITITATQDTAALINALLAGGNTGIVVQGVTLNGQREDLQLGFPGAPALTVLSSGTYSNPSGTYGIGPGVVLSTGGVGPLDVFDEPLLPGYGDGPNLEPDTTWAYGAGVFPPPVYDPEDPPLGRPASQAQEALLDPITGGGVEDYDHYDVTELIISFDMLPGFSTVSFNVVFGSEEYPEYVGSPFVDGFGMFLNGQNIAFVGGQPVNINHPGVMALGGTELDGILAPGGLALLTFSGSVNPTGNQLRFIVADTSDGALDTTVYFSALTGVPLPPAAWLLLTAVGALAGRRWLVARE